MDIKAYIIARLTERSTWLGFIALATSAGVTFFPQFSNVIVAAGASIGGFISAVLPDPKAK